MRHTKHRHDLVLVCVSAVFRLLLQFEPAHPRCSYRNQCELLLADDMKVVDPQSVAFDSLCAAHAHIRLTGRTDTFSQSLARGGFVGDAVPPPLPTEGGAPVEAVTIFFQLAYS